jgi:hypothetical protein
MPLDPAAQSVIEMLEQTMPRVEQYEKAEDLRAVLAASAFEAPPPDPAESSTTWPPGPMVWAWWYACTGRATTAPCGQEFSFSTAEGG